MLPPDLRICDPHFHFWDVVTTPNPNLGAIVNTPHPILGSSTTLLGTYTAASYFRDFADLPIDCGVHVEATTGQQDGGFPLDPLQETCFALEQAKGVAPQGFVLGVVAFVQLARDDAGQVLTRHRELAGGTLRGVRMILNYSSTDPSQCWPQVSRDFLTGDHHTFNRNFSSIAQQGLVFDLQVNWHQLSRAARFIAQHGPDTVVVLDHLGCLKLVGGTSGPTSDAMGENSSARDAGVQDAGVQEGQEGPRDPSSKATARHVGSLEWTADVGGLELSVEDGHRVEEWRAGITELAANPNAHVKISGLEYIVPGWMKAGRDSPQWRLVRALVGHVLLAFGVGRCMVASNMPVEMCGSRCGALELYGAFWDLLTDCGTSADERTAVLHDNAVRVYGLDSICPITKP